MFLIQGFFFLNQQSFNLSEEPVAGTVAAVERGLIRYMYAGIIWRYSKPPRQFVGEMFDHYGLSYLSNIIFDTALFSFSKRYDGRSDKIWYTFTLRYGNIWTGKYEGDGVEKGLSCCVITEVNDSFVDPRSVMK